MAEAFVSLLIENLGSLAIERIGEEVRLVKGVEKDVANLKTNLEDIQVLLKDAEEKQLEDESVRRWLDKLKNASHDVDDVLDEWSYAILEHKIKKEGRKMMMRVLFFSIKKVCFPMLSSCFCFTEVNRLSLRRDIALKIQELNGDLDMIATEKDRYNLNINRVVAQPERPKTICLIDETKVHGRDKDKSVLVSKLFESNDGGRGPHVIPIVGMGGLGKTTLAQLVYNEEKVKVHFDKRIWVCVSDPFEEIKIAKAIIEGLGTSVPNSYELNTLVQCIHESVEGKRFLLVLDDVWLEDYSKWEIFQESLRNCSVGSKILVTTRKEEVAIVMGGATNKIALNKLSKEDCWLIFSQLAFMERTAAEREQLEDIGRQIASKSSGLPLVAKTSGSLMRFKKTPSQWKDILNNELWESKDVKVKEIFAPFLISYYDLPPLEKRCFLYCSIFPKDYDIRRNKLIEMWMSQGYLGQTMNSQKEGRECFENLAMRSFFQDFAKNNMGEMFCKMHDIIHDFAQFLTGNEYILMGIGEKMKPVEESTRHLTVPNISESQQSPTLRDNAKNLRTLHIDSDGYRPLVDEFSPLMRLRTLSLRKCNLDKLPKDIGKLIHLRYLDLSFNYPLEELPEALFDLYNLQTLRLSGCIRLRKLPETIWKLVSLRNLYIERCHKLEGLPKAIGRLTSLQTLDALVVPEDREAYLDVGDLKMLRHLEFHECLYIRWAAKVGNPDEVEKINLKSRQHLVHLHLSFKGGESANQNGTEHDHVTVLESLQPHPNLKSLEITYYNGATVFPGWMMSLVNLTSLRLGFCVNCENLPPLGKMPSLEYLHVGFMESLKKVDAEFLGATETEQVNIIVDSTSESSVVLFPRLEKLDFCANWQWKEWVGYCGATTANPGLTIMPCLHTLIIKECSSLETLPDFLQTIPLHSLSITDSEILKQRCQKETGQEWLKISHIPNIEIDGDYVQRDGVWIQ